MPRRLHLSYANVMSTIAVFIALGGTSYAAITITGKNVKDSSLTGRDIKNSSLTGSDIRNSSLKGADVRNSSLTSSDVKDNSLLAKDFRSGELPTGAQGPTGPAGPAGPTGATGPQGVPGPTQFARVKSDGTLVNGTALSANRISTGTYRLIFPTRVADCAATAASTAFVGFDNVVYRILASTSVGFSSGGSVAANTVIVELFGYTGPSDDSSFSLILACP